MIVEIEIPDYDPAPSLKLPIVFGSQIEATVGVSEFVIRADSNGLRLLAGHLLALAQEGVPTGMHLHYDPGAPLADDSASFAFERIDPAI